MNLKSHYDAIIIGGGIGGLTSAAYLSKYGKRILLIEKNNVPGGCCVSFKRNGFTFDGGAHLLGSCGKYGYLRNLFVKLGANLQFHQLDPTDRYFFDDDVVIAPVDFSDYVLLLLKHANSKEEVDGFLAEVRSIDRKARSQDLPDTRLNITYQQVLQKYFPKEEKIQSILAAQYGFVGERPKNASAYSFVSTTLSYIKDGAFYVGGGSQSIPNELIKIILGNNGDIVFNLKPLKILVDKDIVTGVALDEKRTISCDYVISNINAHELYGNLLQRSEVNNKKLLQSLTVSNSAFCLYIGCSVSDAILKEKIGWHFSSYDMNSNEYLYFFSPSVIDKSLAPKGCNTIQVFTEANYDDFLDDDSFRSKVEKKIIDQLSDIIPKLKEHILCVESATPKTIERYTGNPRGAVFGWAQTPSQLYCDMRFVKPKNLLQAGHWTYPGGGIMAVAISGFKAAQEILNTCRCGK